MNRDKALQAFKDYTANYDAANVNIKLKIDHTYRVASLAERLAKSCGFNERQIDFCWLLGLLHDIGRFEQYTRFGTFKDAKSIDHAEFGADILFGCKATADKESSRNHDVSAAGDTSSDGKVSATGDKYCDEKVSAAGDTSTDGNVSAIEDTEEEPLINFFIDVDDWENAEDPNFHDWENTEDPDFHGWNEVRQMAETAIRLHNKLLLPDDLNERTRMYTNLLRDADKIDIFRVLTEPPYDERNRKIVQYSEKKDCVAASPEIMNCVREHRCVPKKFAKTDFDNLISQCCMGFELNFPESRKIVSSQGYLHELMNVPVADRTMKEQLRALDDEMRMVFGI